MLGAERFELRGELDYLFISKQAALQNLQNFHRFGVLIRVGVSIRKIEQSLHAFVFFAQQFLQNCPGTIQLPGLQQRIGEGVQICHVALGGREGFQQRGSLRGLSTPQFGFGVKQRHAPLVRCQGIGARQQLQRIRRRARSRRKLRGPQKCPGSQRIFPQLRGNLRHFHLSRQLLRVQLRGALPAEQRVFSASRFGKHLGGLGVLFDRFFPAILLLQQKGVARDAFGGLNRQGIAQEAVVNRQRLGFVLGIDQQVKQVPVVDGGAVGLLQPRVQVAQRLRGLQVLRGAIQHGEIGLDRVLDAVLLQKFLRPLQLFADVYGHQGFALGFLPWVYCKVPFTATSGALNAISTIYL